MGLTMRELCPKLLGDTAAGDAYAIPAVDSGPAKECAGDAAPAARASHDFAWYALSVKHQHERAIEAALTYKGFEALAPVYRSRRRWSDRIKQIELPLFAGYVFCRFCRDAKARVLDTPAISRVVGFGGQPAAVPDVEIEAIRAVVNSGQPVRPWPRLHPGDRVRLERGPLRGIEGVLLKEKDAVELIVSVELLQRSVAVQIDAGSVMPVRSAQQRR